jgi:hypothetical protein
MRSQVQSDALTSNEARGYNEKLSNSEASGWDRTINDKSGFTRNLSFDRQESLVGFAKAHGGIGTMGSGAGIGGEYQITATGKDGKTLSFAVDESTAMSVKEAEQDIREKAFTETFGSGHGLQYATSMANKIGATEAASYMKDASNMSRTTETTGADATTAFVRWYANERFGSSGPENIDKAGDALNHMATGGAAGMAQLQDHQQRFLRSGNYTWGDGKAQAEAEISATRGEVGGGAGHIQGQVMPGVNAASGRTENIGTGDFSGHPADKHTPLTSSRVEGQKVLDEAEGMRDSRLEEANQGILMGNRAVHTANSTIDDADAQMKARMKERASAGKPPLEGD